MNILFKILYFILDWWWVLPLSVFLFFVLILLLMVALNPLGE